MALTQDVYQIADELRAVACLGLRFAENGYDVERSVTPDTDVDQSGHR